jgi:hypothetical protein
MVKNKDLELSITIQVKNTLECGQMASNKEKEKYKPKKDKFKNKDCGKMVISIEHYYLRIILSSQRFNNRA